MLPTTNKTMIIVTNTSTNKTTITVTDCSENFDLGNSWLPLFDAIHSYIEIEQMQRNSIENCANVVDSVSSGELFL